MSLSFFYATNLLAVMTFFMIGSDFNALIRYASTRLGPEEADVLYLPADDRQSQGPKLRLF